MPRESLRNRLRLLKPGSQLKNTVPHGSDAIIEHRLARVFVALTFQIAPWAISISPDLP
jgi:hypothetical protein